MPGTATPKISVILPVYNAARYLAEAIDSVLRQSFGDFELIILDDGSQDTSSEIIGSYRDPRIVFVSHANMGLAATLNKGIGMARGEYIARQDNDDISLPDRFKRQVAHLDANPRTALVGTGAEIINEEGRLTGRYLAHVTDPARLKFSLLFNNPFVHSSVMFRRSVLARTGTYVVNSDYFEDFNLWSRMARVGEVHNLRERLLLYREVGSSMSRTTRDYMQRVMNQSVDNILYYCPDIPREVVARCVSCMAGTAVYDNFARDRKSIAEVLEKLGRAFAEKENVPYRLIEAEAGKQVLNFRRHYYNSVVTSAGAGVLEKLRARVLRRLLFIKHKAHFFE